eukprot:TRINITY_DN23128_c0_g2_i4.p2 TRINITY_DN23128_c0_g2~~TRINITY_DN23128_c0_g2_i4.p2  ORF type:complete len:511 (-),score=26.58 TRINITY_DN23128_c0_g2_i4:1679-3211(-)
MENMSTAHSQDDNNFNGNYYNERPCKRQKISAGNQNKQLAESRQKTVEECHILPLAVQLARQAQQKDGGVSKSESSEQEQIIPWEAVAQQVPIALRELRKPQALYFPSNVDKSKRRPNYRKVASIPQSQSVGSLQQFMVSKQQLGSSTPDLRRASTSTLAVSTHGAPVPIADPQIQQDILQQQQLLYQQYPHIIAMQQRQFGATLQYPQAVNLQSEAMQPFAAMFPFIYQQGLLQQQQQQQYDSHVAFGIPFGPWLFSPYLQGVPSMLNPNLHPYPPLQANPWPYLSPTTNLTPNFSRAATLPGPPAPCLYDFSRLPHQSDISSQLLAQVTQQSTVHQNAVTEGHTLQYQQYVQNSLRDKEQLTAQEDRLENIPVYKQSVLLQTTQQQQYTLNTVRDNEEQLFSQERRQQDVAVYMYNASKQTPRQQIFWQYRERENEELQNQEGQLEHASVYTCNTQRDVNTQLGHLVQQGIMSNGSSKQGIRLYNSMQGVQPWDPQEMTGDSEDVHLQ